MKHGSHLFPFFSQQKYVLDGDWDLKTPVSLQRKQKQNQAVVLRCLELFLVVEVEPVDSSDLSFNKKAFRSCI
jgi:hypothetical protein